MFANFPFFGPFTSGFIASLALLVTIIVHISFAVGIYHDGEKLAVERRGPLFVKPLMWAAAVLLGSFPLIAFYWLIHHSRLKSIPPKP